MMNLLELYIRTTARRSGVRSSPGHASRQANAGFTLIELIVVMIIGGILAAIALPSFINQTWKARESEARIYVANVSRDQQRYYMERGSFSPTLARLDLGIPTQTEHYLYQTQVTTDSGNGETVALTVATQGNPNLRAFSGQVWTGILNNTALTQAILCESEAGQAPPIITNHQCP